MSRYETYLRKIAGEDIDISNMPEPSDRIEGYLKTIAENGGGSVDPEAIAEAVSDWLDDHPEATTTVEDGSITKAKLNEDLQETVDDVDELKSALDEISNPTTTINLIDPTTIVHGSYWWNTDPQSGSYSRTGKIAIKPSTAYTFANTEQDYWGASSLYARFVKLWTADGEEVLDCPQKTTNFTTPANAAYCAISFKENATKVLLIEGDYPATEQTMVYVPYVAPATKVDGSAIPSIKMSQIDDYAACGKNLYDPSKATQNSYLQDYPRVTSNEQYFVSDYIPVKAGYSYVISAASGAATRSWVLYDSNHQKVSSNADAQTMPVLTPTVDGYLRFCGYNANLSLTQVEVGESATAFEPFKMKITSPALLNETQMAQIANTLYGKKWAVCGDSFTAGGGTGITITDGRYAGRNYTYPWLIGNRNNMDIVQFFEGGQTLAFPAEPDDFTNSLTCTTNSRYYQNIPADVDYITIYLGINDEHHAPASSGGDGEDNTGEIPLGEITDNTTATYYGAWNVVLSWLIVNRPNAHIGIIVTNGIANHDDYRQGQIAIAKKYGIPYIDMNGDARTPAMLRTSNPDIDASVKSALITKWAVDPTGAGGSVNTHPNDAAQLFESTYIENFLRSI